jgi:hypothetical protein
MNQIEKAVAPLDWSGEDLVMLARLGRFAGCEICPPISYCENSNEDAFLCVAINATWGDPIMGPHTGSREPCPIVDTRLECEGDDGSDPRCGHQTTTDWISLLGSTAASIDADPTPGIVLHSKSCRPFEPFPASPNLTVCFIGRLARPKAALGSEHAGNGA